MPEICLNNSMNGPDQFAMAPIHTVCNLSSSQNQNLPSALPDVSSGCDTHDGKQADSNGCATFKDCLLQRCPSYCIHPEVQRHGKLIMISSFLCIVGTVFSAIGLFLLVLPPHHTFSIAFLVGGVIIFLPGVYYVVYVICAYCGHEGYVFDNLPSMD